jgi:hypothetical protein
MTSSIFSPDFIFFFHGGFFFAVNLFGALLCFALGSEYGWNGTDSPFEVNHDSRYLFLAGCIAFTLFLVFFPFYAGIPFKDRLEMIGIEVCVLLFDALLTQLGSRVAIKSADNMIRSWGIDPQA